jgi:uncharacterized phage protein (TIGR02218 family)
VDGVWNFIYEYSSAGDSDLSTWTTCLKITRTDGQVIGLTELDKDLTINSKTYTSASGYTPSNYSSTSTLSTNYADIEGLLGLAGVSRNQIRAGLFDFADIELFIYDYVAQEIVKSLAIGNWGEATLFDNRYVAEFRSLSQRLQKTVGRLYTPHCTAQFGDARCKKDVSGFSTTGTITHVSSRLVIRDSTKAAAAGYWNSALITFTSGANAGREIEVSSSLLDGTFTLFLPLSFPAQIGDAFTLRRGCDKQFQTCRDVYNNLANFRGFPHIPGNTKVLKVGKA